MTSQRAEFPCIVILSMQCTFTGARASVVILKADIYNCTPRIKNVYHCKDSIVLATKHFPFVSNKSTKTCLGLQEKARVIIFFFHDISHTVL